MTASEESTGRRQAQHDAIASLPSADESLDVEAEMADLKKARKVVARRRQDRRDPPPPNR